MRNAERTSARKRSGCFYILKEIQRIDFVMKTCEMLFTEYGSLRIEIRGKLYPEDRKQVAALCRGRLAGFLGRHVLVLDPDLYAANQGILYKYFSHDTLLSAGGELRAEYVRENRKSALVFYDTDEEARRRSFLESLQVRAIIGDIVRYPAASID